MSGHSWLFTAIVCCWISTASATVLWTDLGATLVRNTEAGGDILGGVIKRDDFATDALYFKFHVDPLSDVATEEYMASFQLFENEVERLGVGNSLKAWAYSAFNASRSGEFNKVFGDIDLKSSRPESSSPGVFLPYELPRRRIESTVLFKVDYVPGGDDLITVWLNPDLAPGATEHGQSEALTTTFAANGSFNQIRLRHSGGGGGWTFSDMAIATSFRDFVAGAGPEAGSESGLERGGLPFTFRHWQREDGLPQNSVRTILQARNGYLWIGSDDGIARFDGVRFTPFGLREGLRSGPVQVLFEDSQSDLWIGTVGGGLTRWSQGQFTTFNPSDGLPSDSITALVEDGQNRLWIGTANGLVIRQEGKFIAPPVAEPFEGKAITALFKDRQGGVWTGVKGSGVFQLTNESFMQLTDPTVDHLLRDPHCILVDQRSRIWVGAGDDSMLCREDGNWRRYRIPRNLARPYIGVLAEEADGTVWAGSVSEGLIQYKEGKLTTVNASSGLPDNLISALTVDREGNLWVGTGAGLTRVRRKELLALGPNDGLGYGAVNGLAEIAPGQLWVAQPGNSVYLWSGRNFTPNGGMSRQSGLGEISALLRTRNGACWVATDDGVLCFPDPANPAVEPGPRALAGLSVLALAEDRAGKLWAGTKEGQLWAFQADEWVASRSPGLKHAITAITHDREDAMWIGTDGAGLFRIKDGETAHFNKERGLLSDAIRTLFLDSRGALWIGTADGGLGHWRQGHLNTITAREGLPDNTILQILEDEHGHLWLGTKRGIARVRKAELESLSAGKITSVYPQVYGRAEGMLSEECTGGFHPAGLKTKSGLLWISTMKGVVVANPKPQRAPMPAPSVVLEQVLVDGIEAADRGRAGTNKESSGPANSGSAQIQVAPGKHRLEFHYTGLSFSAPERVRFRYRLVGLDPDWVEADARRIAFYSYLPPGNYRFQVTACNSDGVWNQNGASMAVTVLPHIWQTWWFIGAVTGALLVGAIGAARVIEKKKIKGHLKQLEQERALERERARIAQDLHDDLGSSLTRISLLSQLALADKDQPSQVQVHANKISQSAGQTVRALEEIVWALRPGSDSLQSLVEYIAHFANELFEGDSARCRLDLPHDLPSIPLPPEMRHNIFLVVKEALANALKHAGAGEVRVQASASVNFLEIVVQDDGRGFDPRTPTDNGERHGLGNMRRRAEAMGAIIEVQSWPGKGTTVRLFVRFHPAGKVLDG